MRTLMLSSILLTAIPAFAGDNPINCRVETVTIPLYGNHQASCTTKNQSPIPNTTLTQFVPEQAEKYKTLVDYSYPFPASCNVTLNFYRNVMQDKQVCDYTPKAAFYTQVITYPVGAKIFTSQSSDRDGTIVKTEWIENGSTIKVRTSVDYHMNNLPSSLVLKVTDNHGYTDMIKVI